MKQKLNGTNADETCGFSIIYKPMGLLQRRAGGRKPLLLATNPTEDSDDDLLLFKSLLKRMFFVHFLHMTHRFVLLLWVGRVAWEFCGNALEIFQCVWLARR